MSLSWIASSQSSSAVRDLTVPVHLNFGVGEHPIRHGLAGPKLVAAHDQVDAAGVFGQVNGLFAGGVTAADDRKLHIAELRGGAIADGAGADAGVPKALLTGEAQAIGAGPGGQDHGVGLDGLPVGLNPEWPLGEVDGIGIGLNQPGAPAHRLGLDPVH